MQSTTIYSFLICFLTFASSFIFNVNAQAIKGMDTVKDSMMMIDPISADRPDQSDGATTLEKGYFQMENGVSIEDIKPGFIYTYPSTLWKIGVSKTFELRVLTEYINITHEGLPDHDGLLPIQVGFKSKLFDQKGLIPDATVIGFLSLPGLASKQFETTYFAPSMRLAFQNDITDKLYVTYNLGAEWNGEDARPNFLYTFEIGANVFHGLGAYIEAYGDVPQQRIDEFQHRLDGGLTCLIGPDVIVDVSGGIGLSDNAPERYIAVGLSYRFKM